MTTTDRRPAPGRPPRRSDKSPWNWLLLLPLLVTLYPPLYNRRTPELFGLPFFYWYQLAVVAVGVACTFAVYRATRTGMRPDTRPASRPAADERGR